MGKIPIDVVVTHTPQDRKRRKFLADMERQLGGVEAIEDRVLRYTVQTDYLEQESQRNRCNRPNAERAWRQPIHPHATHRIVIQDDVAFPVGFFDALEQVIEARPNNIISLMALKNIQKQTYESGRYWMAGGGALTGQAIIMPTEKIVPVWDWIDEYLPDMRWYDTPISIWAMMHGEQLWFTCPSLVEHVGATDSLIGHSNPCHVAALFLPDVTKINFHDVPDRVPSTGAMNLAGHWRRVVEEREEELARDKDVS